MPNSTAVTHVWSVLCSNSMIDQGSNNLTIFNTIERVTISIPKNELEKIQDQVANGAKSFLFPINFELISLFHKVDPKKAAAFDVRIKLITPTGVDTQTVAERKIPIEKDKRNFRLRSRFNHFPVSTPGDYSFRIEMKDVDSSTYAEVASVPIEIQIKEVSEEKRTV